MPIERNDQNEVHCSNGYSLLLHICRNASSVPTSPHEFRRMESGRTLERLGAAGHRASARRATHAGHICRPFLSICKSAIQGAILSAVGKEQWEVVQLRRRQALAPSGRPPG